MNLLLVIQVLAIVLAVIELDGLGVETDEFLHLFEGEGVLFDFDFELNDFFSEFLRQS